MLTESCLITTRVLTQANHLAHNATILLWVKVDINTIGLFFFKYRTKPGSENKTRGALRSITFTLVETRSKKTPSALAKTKSTEKPFSTRALAMCTIIFSAPSPRRVGRKSPFVPMSYLNHRPHLYVQEQPKYGHGIVLHKGKIILNLYTILLLI